MDAEVVEAEGGGSTGLNPGAMRNCPGDGAYQDTGGSNEQGELHDSMMEQEESEPWGESETGGEGTLLTLPDAAPTFPRHYTAEAGPCWR